MLRGYLWLYAWSRVDVEELSVGGGPSFTVRWFRNVSYHPDSFSGMTSPDVTYVNFESEMQRFKRCQYLRPKHIRNIFSNGFVAARR
jgi:hypothetical protein